MTFVWLDRAGCSAFCVIKLVAEKLVGLLQNYWTSTGCGGQVEFWAHLSGGQVKIIPYFYHWIRDRPLPIQK